MENNDPKRKEDVKDVIGQKGWPQEIGRDGERTPMQWNTSVNAGFNTGAKPWLPVDANYTTHNVASESQDANSILNWYRGLIKLRRENSAFYSGDYIALNETDPNVMAYLRRSPSRTALVVLNFSAQPQTIALDKAKIGAAYVEPIMATDAKTKHLDVGSIALAPYGVVIASAPGKQP
jgi:alpha-glucosidase